MVKTAYYDMHVAMGGKMVPFAGYELPVQFAGAGVLKEHLHTRAPNCSSVFDVGHMGQIKWHGKDAVKFLEKMVCGDLQMLKPSEGKLSLIMNEAGCVVDDAEGRDLLVLDPAVRRSPVVANSRPLLDALTSARRRSLR